MGFALWNELKRKCLLKPYLTLQLDFLLPKALKSEFFKNGPYFIRCYSFCWFTVLVLLAIKTLLSRQQQATNKKSISSEIMFIIFTTIIIIRLGDIHFSSSDGCFNENIFFSIQKEKETHVWRHVSCDVTWVVTQ